MRGTYALTGHAGEPTCISVICKSQPSIEQWEGEIKSIENQMIQLAQQLPVATWVESVPGFGLKSLACLIGETGDLANYNGPAQVWKRLGLAPRWAYRVETKSGDEATLVPKRRRSVSWVVFDSLYRTNKARDGYYARVYLDRKAREIQKAHEEGLQVVASSKSIADSWEAAGLERPLTSKNGLDGKVRTCGHIERRAKRYAEKRLIRDLWRQWNRPAAR
jgi:hypothetical protein